MAPQREWFEQDYYATLGVPETATAKEITKAYAAAEKPANLLFAPAFTKAIAEVLPAWRRVVATAVPSTASWRNTVRGPAGARVVSLAGSAVPSWWSTWGPR